MTSTLHSPAATYARRNKSRLFQRLLAGASAEALDAARSFCIDLIAATVYAKPALQRTAGTAFLLLLDALNEHRTARSRELRWRRLLRLAKRLALQTRDETLSRFVEENADLIR
ncbi:MAG TPA: hypothetical protein VGZ02_13660 [Candidatus Baltobacteraceae bacterium]|jgi:hypothetical protein|nr:hypothetical protein [Candidatus Baltobacteraceae bacterium]